MFVTLIFDDLGATAVSRPDESTAVADLAIDFSIPFPNSQQKIFNTIIGDESKMTRVLSKAGQGVTARRFTWGSSC